MAPGPKLAQSLSVVQGPPRAFAPEHEPPSATPCTMLATQVDGQIWQGWPFMPHALGSVPGWQLPLSQQPVGHNVGLQDGLTQTP